MDFRDPLAKIKAHYGLIDTLYHCHFLQTCSLYTVVHHTSQTFSSLTRYLCYVHQLYCVEALNYSLSTVSNPSRNVCMMLARFGWKMSTVFISIRKLIKHFIGCMIKMW